MDKYEYRSYVVLSISFTLSMIAVFGMVFYLIVMANATQQAVVQAVPCPSPPPIEAGVPEALEYFDRSSDAGENCQEGIEAWIYDWTALRK